eukprot:gnl/MRDRNA2_/MRDRNA2_94422_c0_seq1.p1 gnl/MRDRNA2_/MRDRNA2_94422_c0~~gnl/MRDRNA2_/MRDRNA2_94422_c0_seq1.p1  ORF type:complete len:567 (+),score=121.78 gnl/MRDRNA2_/MRDRNA2_94422_c0_seq1:94-1794(+)
MSMMSGTLYILLSVSVGNVEAAGFRNGLNSRNTQSVRADLDGALSAALGNGHGVEAAQFQEVKKMLESTFRALPKNAYGRIEAPMLRYTIHRYFSTRYSIAVKGLEPTRNASSDQSVGAEILLDQIPNYVEGLLEGRFGHKGFGLEDVAGMAVALEHLILGSSTGPLGKAYALKNFSPSALLNDKQLDDVMEVYVLQWLVGDGTEINANELVQNRTIIEQSMPQWVEVTQFARGEVQRYLHARQHKLNPFTRASERATYSFEDVNGMIRGITSGFGHWWEQECQGIKANLVALDPEGKGRAKLSKFYHAAMKGEWRFGESEAYLRELGALDDSSYWQGPQVLIPNYLLAASNCIVASTFYRVCCVNECEALQQRVEDMVQAPVGSAEDVMRAAEDVFRTDLRGEQLQLGLKVKLQKIADTHQGKVPLHGRLFAQWMHYAFPQECPFPHRSGQARARTPAEFGEGYMASNSEKRRHARKINRTTLLPRNASQEETWGMSQWLDDEELLADYTELRSSNTSVSFYVVAALVLMGAMMLLAHGPASLFSLQTKRGGHWSSLPMTKQHCV